MVKYFFILALILLLAQPAHAGEGTGATLPIRVKLVSCGPTVEKACKRDHRCCSLLDSYDLAQSEPVDDLEQQLLDPHTDSSIFDIEPASGTQTELLQ